MSTLRSVVLLLSVGSAAVAQPLTEPHANENSAGSAVEPTHRDPPEVAHVEAPQERPETPSGNVADTGDPPDHARPSEGTPSAAPTPGAARPPRRDPTARMFSSSDDRAERERLRALPRTRRRDPNEPEVLELAGMPDAYFFRAQSNARRRIFVYLHSRGANPHDACQTFRPVVTRLGWLVCPVGPGDRGGGRHVWNNNALLARRYSVAAVRGLAARFPRRVRSTDNVLMGFSEGAFVAMQTGLYEPEMFSRWVIFAAHDGYIDMNHELYTAARTHLRRIYLITGAHDEIVAHTRRAEALIRRERLGRVQMQILPTAHHELPPDFGPTVRRALQWVTH